MTRPRLIAALAVAAVLGIGLLVLQRWVAETRDAAILLVSIWFALVAFAVVALGRREPALRFPLYATFAAIAVGAVALGYWTGFRDNEVNEEVLTAMERASASDRESALADMQDREGDAATGPGEATGPVELARGDFTGADGHAATGVATVVRDTDGTRSLTFTDFDVDPGPGVVVWLTRDGSSLDDRINLGELKGNVGDQSYELPDDADLRTYDTVVLYCTPFTVRIAVAPLS